MQDMETPDVKMKDRTATRENVNVALQPLYLAKISISTNRMYVHYGISNECKMNGVRCPQKRKM